MIFKTFTWLLFFLCLTTGYSQKSQEEYHTLLDELGKTDLDSALVIGNDYLSRTHLHNQKKFHFKIIKKIVKLGIQKGDIESASLLTNNINKNQLLDKSEEVELILLKAELLEYEEQTDSALVYYLEAIKLSENEDLDQSLALSYSNIASMYLYLGDLPKGKTYFFSSMDIYESLHDQKGLSRVYNNLGVLYRLSTEMDSARIYYTKAIEIRIKLNDQDGLSSSYMNLGITEEKDSNFSLAEEYYLKSKSISEATHNPTNILLVYVNLGNLKYKSGEYKAAEDYYLSGIEIADGAEFSYYKKHLFLCLSRLFEKKGDYKKSLEYSKLYNSAYQEYHSYSKEQTIQELEKKYESEKVLKENALLAEANEKEKLAKEKAELSAENQWVWTVFFALAGTILVIGFSFIFLLYKRNKSKNVQLNILLDERELLLKEVHHRVKNNLQIVSSLLNLQKKASDKKSAKEILQESQDRIDSMSILHERLYKSDRLNEISFKDYVGSLTENLMDSVNSEGLEIEQEIQANQLGLDHLVPCGLIINELLTNSIKYAFAGIRNKKIFIRSKIENEVCHLEIGDNGNGFEKEVDMNNLSSLGLRLVYGLVMQMDGSIDLSQEKNSTSFKIKFAI